MFHQGFEWPLDERKKFVSRIKKENWPVGWLDMATTDGDPWCIYLSNSFIWHCIETIEKVIESIGLFVAKLND